MGLGDLVEIDDKAWGLGRGEFSDRKRAILGFMPL